MVNLGRAISLNARRLRSSVRGADSGRAGLSALTELSFVNAAGDALVTVTLAGSLFFSVSSAEARSKVALYLLITMVPFALLAPVIGPLLDRVAHGRRTALAALCLARGLLAWQLAGALDGLSVYPLALGLLVLSRAFGVARSAVTPRVAPAELSLVRVNSRITLVNVVAGAIIAPIGLGIANVPFVGYPWVLRLCAIVYMAGVLLAFNLPGHVDSAAGELPLRAVAAPGLGHHGLRARLRAALGAMPVALRATLVLRGLVGFLTFYLAFLLRTSGGNNLWLGGLAIAAGAGSGLGVAIGGRLGQRRPEGILMLAMVMAAGGCLGAAVTYTRLTSLLAALLASMAGSMGKLALDTIIQRDIPETSRNSAFAQAETALQLTWVAGGALGLIRMPGTLGFALAAAAVIGTGVVQSRALRRARLAARARLAVPPGSPAPPPAQVQPAASQSMSASQSMTATQSMAMPAPPSVAWPAEAAPARPAEATWPAQPGEATYPAQPAGTEWRAQPVEADWPAAEEQAWPAPAAEGTRIGVATPAPIPPTLDDPTRPDAPRQRRRLGGRRRRS
ncbi:Integral membrane protein [Frankia sp. AiPs1]|uniref:MFS transporter n=1 Tax=Frankia sp. AiPa1 TaxID=573492 RepID=UPI00202B3592|nr:MFS transporter [Frankia sp. AiPa1]MCL9761148.1 MFS transporter [Frankia sp. AiPa1]